MAEDNTDFFCPLQVKDGYQGRIFSVHVLRNSQFNLLINKTVY